MGRVSVELHLNDQGNAVGGGWAYYNPSDELVASWAVPGFVAPLELELAAEFLLHEFRRHCGHQLAF